MARPALRLLPMLGIAGLALLPACAFHGPYAVREVHPVHVGHAFVEPGPAFATPVLHAGVTLIFDRDLGCHTVRGRPDHYFHHDHFYRHRDGHWQVGEHIGGPWRHSEAGRVPERLRRRYERPTPGARPPLPRERTRERERTAPPRERTAVVRPPERPRERTAVERPPERPRERTARERPPRPNERGNDRERARDEVRDLPEPARARVDARSPEPRERARPARARVRPVPRRTTPAREARVAGRSEREPATAEEGEEGRARDSSAPEGFRRRGRGAGTVKGR